MNHALNNFFIGIEKRAFRMAQLATKDSDHALDIVQDTMMQLAQKYASKSQQDWSALFYRILQNKIIDWHRKQTLKNKLFNLFGFVDEQMDAAGNTESIAHYQPNNTVTPDKNMESAEINNKTMLAIEQLPIRQQQAFLLRQWQGLSVRDTASAMSISEGSVKTHYSRAVQQLKRKLEDIYYA